VRVELPVLGLRTVVQAPESTPTKTHWLWLDGDGWHDCTAEEDEVCARAAARRQIEMETLIKHLQSIREAR